LEQQEQRKLLPVMQQNVILSYTLATLVASDKIPIVGKMLVPVLQWETGIRPMNTLYKTVDTKFFKPIISFS
jgi:hypothetical protein